MKTSLMALSVFIFLGLSPCHSADPVVTWPYIVTTHDTSGYGLWCHIHATDPDGNDDIVSATVEGPLGTVYQLDPAGDGQFTLYTVFGGTPPPLGDYTAVVVDAAGHPSAPAIREVDNVIEQITVGILPHPNALVGTESPTFYWTEVTDAEQPIVSYCIQVWSLSPGGGWDQMIWVYCDPSPAATYNSNGSASMPLTEGDSYAWKAEAQDEDGNFSYAVNNFTVVSPEQSIADGLEAHWPFDTDASDVSGNGHDATLNGGATITEAGRLGGALDLRGTDSWAAVPAGVLPAAPTCSIAFSVSSESFPTSVCCIGMYATDAWDVTGGIHLNLDSSATSAEMAVYGYTDCFVPVSLGPEWTHLAFSYDSVIGKMDMYVDGSWVTDRYGPTGVACGAGLPASIGAWNQDGAGSMTRFHDGRIDDVRIYDRTLTAGEVSALANLHHIFSDGFEGGDTSAWTATIGSSLPASRSKK